MNRIAIFVEGQTEALFSEKLLTHMAGQKGLQIETHRMSGGKRYPRGPIQITRITISSPEDHPEGHYVLIVDCGGDNRVASEVLDQSPGLINNGYETIVAIRDVHPLTRRDIPKLETDFDERFKFHQITILLVLAVMEIEAWFIAEHTHFGRRDAALSMDFIKSKVGFDPSLVKIETRVRPSEDILQIYQLVGIQYTKSKSDTKRAINSLDYERICFELPEKVQNLGKLIATVDAFLS